MPPSPDGFTATAPFYGRSDSFVNQKIVKGVLHACGWERGTPSEGRGSGNRTEPC